MFILVDDNLVEEEHATDDFKDCIRMLMIAYKEGQHIISISPKSVDEILKKEYFRGITKSLLEHYYNHFSRQVGVLQPAFNTVCIVVSDSNLTKSYSDIDSKTKYICLKCSDLKHSYNIQKTTILGENLTDCRVFSTIGEYYLNELDLLSNILIQCEFMNGGGDTTCDVYKCLYECNNKFCLCILDSDQRHSSCTFGQTAKKVIKYLKSNTTYNPKCTLRILEGFLELENILPDSFYSTVYGSDVNKSSIKTMLDGIPPKSRNYIDLKNGLYCKIIQKHDSISLYWREIFCILHRIDCPVDINGSISCSHKIIKGYGTKTLSDFIEYQENSCMSDEVNSSRADIKMIWNDLGKDVASFCCGHPPVIAV